MKIKSSFKDGYDYVAHVYGAPDDSVTYDRQPIPHSPESKQYTFVSQDLWHPTYTDQWRRWRDFSGVMQVFDALVIAGNVYPIHNENGKRTLLTPSQCAEVDKVKLNTASQARFRWYQNNEALSITRAVGVPVFIIPSVSMCYHKLNYTTVECKIPRLEDLGVFKHISPERVYQEIDYFLTNTIRTNPDVAPPVTVSDKDRILQHGFDIKQSFRHRM
jgi:hypothetical protein